MSQPRLKQIYLERSQEAYKLLNELEQRIIVESNPIDRSRLELDRADLLRKIEQYENLLEKIEAGADVPEIGDVAPQSNSATANPFNQIGIVTERWFIGRSSQLKRIREALTDNVSVLLVGPSKIGKTSLMWQFMEVSRELEREVLYIDFKMPDMTIREHYAEVTQALNSTGSSFRDIVKAIKGRKITLFVDEFELAVEGGLDAKQLLAFKGLATNKKNDFQIIAASSKPASEIYGTIFDHSKPYGFLTHEQLEPFNETEANLLFDSYLGNAANLFDFQTRKELVELSGGHPFMLQRAAYRFYEGLLDASYDWRKAYDLDIRNMM